MSDTLDLMLKKEFIDEATEMLAWVEESFLEFEKDPHDAKVIDKIFRLAHTIKGSAMTCGFHELGSFAHIVEALLVKIRSNEVDVNSEIVDILLRANDRLTRFVAALKADSTASIDTSDVAEEIQLILALFSPTSSSAAPASGFVLFDDDESPPMKAAPPHTAVHQGQVGDITALGLQAYVRIAKASFAQESADRESLQLLQQLLSGLQDLKLKR